MKLGMKELKPLSMETRMIIFKVAIYFSISYFYKEIYHHSQKDKLQETYDHSNLKEREAFQKRWV